ncbi:MAG TPA: OsmC family peroxiredoxin [Ignavibacteriaceae bacterium]|nr:OsmC family peroxiredoxin [Ignavibacteriaceae bacterium]
MAVRKGNAEWNGDLKTGKGTLSSETKVLMNVPYDAASRFETGKNTNPEELIGAAHAACYSMALAHGLSTAGYKVNSIRTEDKVHIERKEAGFTITKIEINTVGAVEKIDEAEFKKHAETTKTNCPVSRALTGVEMVLTATLKR